MNSECLEAFQRLKLGKKCKYIIFRVSDDLTEIIVDKESKGGDYEDFTEDLPSDQCRWGVFDLEYRIEVEGEPHAKRNKILFVSWFVFTLLSCRAFSFFNKKDNHFFFYCHMCYSGLRSQVTRYGKDQAEDVGRLLPKNASERSRWYPSRGPSHRIQRSEQGDGCVPTRAQQTTYFLLITRPAVVDKAKRTGK